MPSGSVFDPGWPYPGVLYESLIKIAQDRRRRARRAADDSNVVEAGWTRQRASWRNRGLVSRPAT